MDRRETLPEDPTLAVLSTAQHTLAGMLLVAAVIFLERRLVVAFDRPLGLAATLIAPLVVGALGILATWPLAERQIRHDTILRAVTTAAILIWTACITMPGQSLAASAWIWFSSLAACGWIWSNVARVAAVELPGSTTPNAAEAAPPLSTAAKASPAEDEHLPPPSDVVQKLVRRRDAAGRERIEGWLRIDIVPGQRVGSAHVSFCPPFPELPECAVEPMELTAIDPAAEVVVGQVLPQGARVDVRLARASDCHGSVVLEFAAWPSDATPRAD